MKRPLLLLFVIALLYLPQTLLGQAVGDYRSFQSGAWNVAANWARWNGSAWVNPAPTAPTSADSVITIQSGHTMQITANVSLDQVVINAGGTINWTGGTCTFVNSTVAGPDLIINGTFIDNRGAGTPSITFTAPATWQMGANGTLIRTSGNSSNNWQNNYQGGISTIPSTSNWILRKTGAQNPSITSVGAFYPNLIVENNTATAWAPTFTGGGTTTIKGNFDIGGSGAGAGVITFSNTGTLSPSTIVQGDMIVRTPHSFVQSGNGIALQGNLTVNSNFGYSGTNGRMIFFQGGNAQAISGPGNLALFAITINKSANSLTLNRPILVDNAAVFTNGVVNTTAANILVLNTGATCTVTSPTTSNSFVSGPVTKLGSTGITFPVGKNGKYRPLILGNGTPGIFWQETFGSSGGGCATQNQQVTSFTGVNGAWTQTILGAEGTTPNLFFVSSTEAGMGLGICGDGCLANSSLDNQTLHVGSDPSSPAAFFFCPTGDCGAAYDAGLGGGQVLTNRRAESPTIDCSGRSNIIVTFDYLENGAGVNDNALFWYFDGSSWSLLADIPKSPTGSCGTQGQWSPYTINLPASANNNPNVKIGFQWVNNDDGAGGDPSFAVDNITLTNNVPSFTAEYFDSNPQVPFGSTLAPTLTNLSNCEYWILNRNASTDARTVTLSWNQISCAVSTLTDVRVARHDGVTWQDHGNGGTTGVLPGDPSCLTLNSFCGTVITSATVGSFSPFAIANVTAPLPVELISFTAECQDQQVNLEWSTSSELNNESFTLQRSADGETWVEIGRLPGAGNSNQVVYYGFTDHSPAAENYYRLIQRDYDGTEKTYGPIYTSCTNQTEGLNIYPNPSSGMVNMEVSGDWNTHTLQFNLTNLLGSRISLPELIVQKSGGIYMLNGSLLPAGQYLLEITDGHKHSVKPVIITGK